MTQTDDSQASELAMDDPRMGFAAATEAVGELMGTVTDDQLSLPTPCTEFDVKDLLDHIVHIHRRACDTWLGSCDGTWCRVQR